MLADVSFVPMFAPWAIFLAAVVFTAAAWYHYRGESDALPPRRRGVLLALRLGGLGLLVLILAGPTLAVRRTHRLVRPLAVVVDTSLSMSRRDCGQDGKQSRIDAARIAAAASLPRLGAEYALSVYGAASACSRLAGPGGALLPESIEAGGDRTALGDCILEAAPRKPQAAVLVLSDGASNAGTPLSAAARALSARGAQVFAVPFGRPSGPNIAVRRVLGPRVLLRGEPAAFFVEISATGGVRLPVKVELKDGDAVAATAAWNGPDLLRLDFKPARDGDITYTIEAEGDPAEEVTADNRAERTVRVAKEKLKVLYVEDLPRWEYRFIKNAILRDDRIEPKLLLISGDRGLTESPYHIAAFPHVRAEIFKFDCIVIGDVAPDYFLPVDLENLRAFASEGGGGVLFVAGPNHNPSGYTTGTLSELCPADFAGVAETPVDGFAIGLTGAGSVSPALTLSTGDQQAVYASLPKIFWLAGVKPRAAATVLAKAAPGGAPVIVEQAFGRGRSVLVATDELWRWRSRGGDRYLYRLWVQLARYLGARRLSGGGAGELALSADEYARGDEVSATAYLENGLGMPVDDATAEGFIEDAGGRRVAVTFSADAGAPGLYRAQVPAGAPGKYALCVRGPEGLVSAPFVVSDKTRETPQADADVAALEALAAGTAGKVLSPDRILDILEYYPPEASVETRFSAAPLWASYWIVVPLAAFFSAEWYLRKRWGLM